MQFISSREDLGMEMTGEKMVLEMQLYRKAASDTAFRKLLKNNPRQAIELETGVVIPPLLKIKCLEEEPRTIYIVIPSEQQPHPETEEHGEPDHSPK